MLHEQIGILIERAVVGIRIKDELGIRQVLLENVRVHRGYDDVVAALRDQRRLADVLQIVQDAIAVGGVFADRRALRQGGFLADLRIAVRAPKLALQEGEAGGLA